MAQATESSVRGTADRPAADQPEIVQLELALFRAARAVAGLRTPSAGEACDGAALVVLAALDQAGSLRLSTLAGMLGLDPSTVSRHVRHLEAADLIARCEDPDDRRAHQLVATSSGHAQLGAARARRQQILATALADWHAADRAQLATLLDRLSDQLSHQPTPRAPGKETR